MPAADYPNILVLSETEISSSSATGSLMRELFANFPTENVFQITWASSSDEIAKKYQQKLMINFQGGGAFPLRRFFNFIGFSFRFNPKFFGLYSAVFAFQPEIIYVRIAENLFPFSDLALSVSRYFQIPIISHVMDDYDSPLKHSTQFNDRVLKRWLFRSDLTKLLQLSAKIFTISPPMSKTFEQRYGVESEVIHNGVDPAEWSFSWNLGRNREVTQTLRPFKIVMAGSIDDRKDARVIQIVAELVDQLNRKGLLDCSLVLNVSPFFLSRAQDIASMHEGVSAQEYLPLAEYRRMLSSADCLLLARNFDQLTQAYTGLSFHNKLPEYLASGSIVLCIAPDTDGSSSFLTKHKAGVVLNTLDEASIEKCILEIAEFPERFVSTRENARKVTFREFDIQKIRDRFEKSIKTLARQHVD